MKARDAVTTVRASKSHEAVTRVALDGWIFDIDGTLVDSNGLHAEAWEEAFAKHGYRVSRDRLDAELGKGGDHFVTAALGEGAEKKDGDALRKAQGKTFERLAKSRGIAPADGARELIEAMRKRGLQTAIATSSKPEQIDIVEQASGVRWRELVDVVADAGDVEASKPSPDVVHAALKKLGMTATQCGMVGDTPWDAQAALRAGVVLVGLTWAGNTKETLVKSGARIIEKDARSMLARLDEVLHRASPGRVRLDAATLERLAREALDAAETAMRAGEVPIGAVLADGDGKVVARGWNRFNETGDRVAHAEIDAFRAAGSKLDPRARDAILASSLEPCVMCTGAAMETAVDAIVFSLPAPADAGTRRVTPPTSVENQMCRVVGGVLAAESRALFERWLARPGHNVEQEPYVRELLAIQPG